MNDFLLENVVSLEQTNKKPKSFINRGAKMLCSLKLGRVHVVPACTMDRLNSLVITLHDCMKTTLIFLLRALPRETLKI